LHSKGKGDFILVKYASRKVQLLLALITLVSIAGASIPFIVSRTASKAAPVQPLIIYSDGLATKWQNWSWGSAVNLANSAPVYAGNRSISVTGKTGWSGLALSTPAIDVTAYQALTFVARASQTGQKYSVALYNERGSQMRQPVPLASYGGNPTPGRWKTYTIPLSDLVRQDKLMTRLLIQNWTPQKQPALYLDEIKLVPREGATTVPIQATTATKTGSIVSMPALAPRPGRYFATLPPGSPLPSDAECTARVRRSSWEPRPENAAANHTAPTSFIQDYSRFGPLNAYGKNNLLPRISGRFSGTTDEIIQWGACKWGFDEDIVRAVAVQESSWRQATVGDNGQSFGLIQIKRTYVPFTHPNSQKSTAFNVDYALGMRRACYEGSIAFLNNGYRAGDEWGCVGYWFSGVWYAGGAQNYIGLIQKHLANKEWNKYGAGPAPTPPK
jgi:autotransporter family porin